MATKPEQPWTLTLRQYERAIMESCLAGMPDNDKISKAISTSGGSLILALHDEPVLIEATAKRLPAATTRPAMGRVPQ